MMYVEHFARRINVISLNDVDEADDDEQCVLIDNFEVRLDD